jgi:general secretion pathway protein A
MYLQFYGLNDLPFRLAPDPKYLFRTESMVEAMANLEYGIDSGKGIIVVTGEAGTGKTTTLRSNLKSLDRRVMAAYIFNPLLSTDEFFDTLLSEFKLSPQPSKSAMLRAMGHLLLSRHLQGLRTVLFVDEAHLLPAHLLEEIRLLSNFETNREKLLQVILCGQPELLDVLEQPQLRQFKQRIALRCSIQPMSLNQTSEYIRWRLCIAGSTNEALFEPEALALIHSVSTGIPRTINNICDNALMIGFSEESNSITAEMVSEVIELLGLAGSGRSEGAEAWGTSLSETEPLTIPGAMMGSGVRENGLQNVHYLQRQNPVMSRGRFDAPQAARDNVRFIIEFDGEDSQASPGRFFSRVRVSKR